MAKGIGIQLLANETGYDLDIKVKYDNGLIISGFVVGDVLYQNQALILLSQKGEFKENPLLGVGINDVCNDHDFTQWRREITEQLEADGQRIDKLILNEKGLTLEAKYK